MDFYLDLGAFFALPVPKKVPIDRLERWAWVAAVDLIRFG